MRRWRRITSQLGGMLFRKRHDEALDLELQSHIDMQTDDNVRAGMPPADARRAALLKFGGLASTAERYRDQRGLPLAERLGADVRYAARALRRTPGFTSVAVLTIALGIAAATAVFSLVNEILLHPAGVAAPARLVVLHTNYSKLNLSFDITSAHIYSDVRGARDVFDHVGAMSPTTFNYSDHEHPVRLSAAAVSAGWFDVFGAAPLLGRSFTVDDDEPQANRVVVLSYGGWMQMFGGEARAIGATVELSGLPYRVIGVMPSRFDEPRSVELWVPLALSPQALAAPRWANENLTVVARMRDGVSFDQANSWLRLASTRMLGDAPPVVRGRITDTGWQLLARRFMDASAGPARVPMLILLGAVGVVLLVACIDIAGLMLARMAVRTRELAVRAALGASRARLLGQGVAESIILGCAGGVLGVVLTRNAIDLLLHVAPDGSVSGLEPRLDPYVLAFAAAATIAATLLFAAVSAWHIARLDLDGLANSSGRTISNAGIRQRLRSGLVVAESALALLLLMSAGVFLRSLASLERVDPGFDPRGVETASFALPKSEWNSPDKQMLFARAVLERLHDNHAVASASIGYPIPFGVGYEGAGFTIDGRPLRPGEPVPEAERRWVTPDYARTLGLSLVRGRFLSDLDRAGTEPVAVIDDKLSREYFPAGDALDQHIQTTSGDGPFRIVGIVNHVAQSTLATDTDRGVYYMSLFQRPMPIGSILVKGTGASAAATAIRDAVRTIDPALPLYDVKSMPALMTASLGPRRFIAQILSAFAGASLLLAALGLYGIVNYTVTQRNREIGIRMALGAERRRVLRLVVAEGMRLAATGLAIGLAGVLMIAPLFQRELFHVTAFDPLTTGGTIAVLLSAASLASYLPARRAARIDPAITLRDE